MSAVVYTLRPGHSIPVAAPARRRAPRQRDRQLIKLAADFVALIKRSRIYEERATEAQRDKPIVINASFLKTRHANYLMRVIEIYEAVAVTDTAEALEAQTLLHEARIELALARSIDAASKLRLENDVSHKMWEKSRALEAEAYALWRSLAIMPATTHDGFAAKARAMIEMTHGYGLTYDTQHTRLAIDESIRFTKARRPASKLRILKGGAACRRIHDKVAGPDGD